MNAEKCPCGSEKTYTSCCKPYISGKKKAPNAEVLLRSRYTAYTKLELDYVANTMKGSNSEQFDYEKVKTWASESEWKGLEIIKVTDNKFDNIAWVEFKAHYNYEGKDEVMYENAEFRYTSDDGWFFVDGKIQETVKRESKKIGRNEPCPCGSGKKYKKCCLVK